MNVTHRLMALHCFRPKGAFKGFLRAPLKDSLGLFRGSFKRVPWGSLGFFRGSLGVPLKGSLGFLGFLRTCISILPKDS